MAASDDENAEIRRVNAPLLTFPGGLELDSHKTESSDQPIRTAPLPSRLIVPLSQSSRGGSRAIVAAGDKVLKGQMIGAAEGIFDTAVHAPTSGTVTGIESHPIAHPSGLAVSAIVIEPDGEDRWTALEPLDIANTGRDELVRHLQASGIVGMGGATFPSHIKLGQGSGIDTLIINGAECEPWITCDDRLMRERAADIIAGARILHRLIGARRLLIGIEDNKPEAIAAMNEAAGDGDGETKCAVVAIPTRYPAGGEKQLVRVLTGIEIPFGKHGGQLGVQCFNAGTTYAVHRALAHGEPLISRIVTVTGNVERAGNYETLLGTPVAELLTLAGVRSDTDRALMGGPMMGIELPRFDVPIAKGSNCIIAASPALFPPPPPEQACLRCTNCARACPQALQPFELYWHARAGNFDKARNYHIFDCIECGCCAYVCPAHIPLVDYFRYAKDEIRARDEEKRAADQARDRFEFRTFRHEREKAEKAARLAAMAAETRAALARDENASQAAATPEKPPARTAGTATPSADPQ